MRTIALFAVAVIMMQLLARPVQAQMMRGFQYGNSSPVTDTGETAADEAEGKALFGKLSAGTTSCAALSDDNFEKIGEYSMGLMVGDAHAAMNEVMKRRLGSNGEEQMHIIMGKRFSRCDATAGNDNTYWTGSWMPMMGMMGGYAGNWGGGMIYGYGLGYGSGWWPLVPMISTLLIWIVCILTIVALVRYVTQLKSSKDKK